MIVSAGWFAGDLACTLSMVYLLTTLPYNLSTDTRNSPVPESTAVSMTLPAYANNCDFMSMDLKMRFCCAL